MLMQLVRVKNVTPVKSTGHDDLGAATLGDRRNDLTTPK